MFTVGSGGSGNVCEARNIWILTLVKRGFIQEPEIYYEESKALNRKHMLMSDINPDYDEIAVFKRGLP